MNIAEINSNDFQHNEIPAYYSKIMAYYQNNDLNQQQDIGSSTSTSHANLPDQLSSFESLSIWPINTHRKPG